MVKGKAGFRRKKGLDHGDTIFDPHQACHDTPTTFCFLPSRHCLNVVHIATHLGVLDDASFSSIAHGMTRNS